MRIVAIIQARMGSARLPGKVVSDISGRPMLAHVIERALAIKGVNKLVVATSVNSRDNSIEELATQMGISVFRGDENDVLARYCLAAHKYYAEAVLRITGDCPLIDPDVSAQVIDNFIKHKPDYASNCLERTYPRGLDTEIFTMEALDAAFTEARSPAEREHVTPFIQSRPERFRLLNVGRQLNLSHLRWTVDTEEDLNFVREIYSNLWQPASIFSMSDILALLNDKPELNKINQHVKQKVI